MDDLKRALEARGLATFTPVFDGNLHELGNGAWFIGWIATDMENRPISKEACWGTDYKWNKWTDNAPLPEGVDMEECKEWAEIAREHYHRQILSFMSKSVLAEREVVLGGRELYPLPAQEDFAPIPAQFNAKGKEVTPPQQLIADSLVGGFGKNFIRDGEDPFYWQGTHWQPRNPKNFRRYLMDRGEGLRSSNAKHTELSSIYELFMNSAPALDDTQTVYQQNPYLANFLDGTLEVKKQKNGTYTKEFREHRREDYLTWVLPYHYKAPRLQNAVFTDWLAKAFAEDEDGAGKIRALKQIGGACLISLFPRICFLVSNQGGTGKSTFAKLCMKFMGQGNYSSLAPHLMEGFHMETMIGKQANIVTDIGKKAVVSEDFMKLVEDGLPILVNRKGRPAVQARIPALHLFCANRLPRGIDGESNAMDRRVSIVEFTKSMLGDNEAAYTRDYEEVILRAGPGAVLDFFEDGLADLLESGGIYFNPESGKEKLKHWKDSESMTAQFIEALSLGEVGPPNAPFMLAEGERVLRSKISDAMAAWAGKPLAPGHITKLFSELSDRGFPSAISKGRRFVVGIKDPGLFG